MPRFALVPHNANAANLSYEGLPMLMFEEAVKRIRANVNKLILWLDTCHAGAVMVSSRGVNTGEDLAEALGQASGQYVLSAAKSSQMMWIRLTGKPGQSVMAKTFARCR